MIKTNVFNTWQVQNMKQLPRSKALLRQMVIETHITEFKTQDNNLPLHCVWLRLGDLSKRRSEASGRNLEEHSEGGGPGPPLAGNSISQHHLRPHRLCLLHTTKAFPETVMNSVRSTLHQCFAYLAHGSNGRHVLFWWFGDDKQRFYKRGGLPLPHTI